jgi:hypothetical protein
MVRLVVSNHDGYLARYCTNIIGLGLEEASRAWSLSTTAARTPERHNDSRIPDVRCLVSTHVPFLEHACRMPKAKNFCGQAACNGSQTLSNADQARGPLWVNRVGFAGPRRLPVYPGERTFSGSRPCLKGADIVAKVENRATRKISRKLTFGLLSGCVAFQRHHGGP